jgi:CRP-like cAMP-binding protein
VHTTSAADNHVLGALPAEAQLRLAPFLEEVVVERGEVLFEPGERPHQIYFPVDAIVALLCSTEAGESSAIALTGCEGVVGASLFLGREIPATRALVHAQGRCYRAAAAVLRAELAQGGVLHALASRHMLDTLSQMAQSAVCNRHHKLDQQLCRWLLMTLDRSDTDLLHLTQEGIAALLGVRREGVSQAASRLEAAGLIASKRGRIRVLDRGGVEALACECYAITRARLPSLHPMRNAVFRHQAVQRHA